MQGHHPLALSPLALRPLLADCPTQAKGKYENRLLEKTDQCGETSGQRQGLLFFPCGAAKGPFGFGTWAPMNLSLPMCRTDTRGGEGPPQAL